MNLDTEIQTHMDWKAKFRSAIRARGRFDATTVGDDHRCPLGQWLHGEARTKFGHLEAYRNCLGAHAAFHREAGHIAELINRHEYEAAEAALSAESGYQNASSAVVSAIQDMKRDTLGR